MSGHRPISSETLLLDLIVEGIENGSCCPTNLASLRFKFNETFARVQQLMIKYPHYHCREVRKNLMLLRHVIQDLMTLVLLEKSISLYPTQPLKESTPLNLNVPPEVGAQQPNAIYVKTPEVQSRTFNVPAVIVTPPSQTSGRADDQASDAEPNAYDQEFQEIRRLFNAIGRFHV